MDPISLISWSGAMLTGYIVPFLFVLTIVVFFHELGHFLVARWCGVGVKVFSVGFGPEIFGWFDKHGTRWRVSWIPLGGYVKFVGDEGAASTPDHDAISTMSEEERAGAFHLKPLGARAAVVAAGPIANFLLAIVIFTVMFAFIGRQVTTAYVDSVSPESAAEEAGFQAGDLVVEIDGIEIERFSDMQRIVSVSAGIPPSVVVERNGEDIVLTATPQLKEISDRFGNVQKIGILGISRSSNPENFQLERFPLHIAVVKGVEET
ncbi:MAG: site-2 protease family protein, partial [Fimbriimonadaceae bacterium]|nr:site-2 protease family protein [Alphaproteobacteria bacterium]